MRSALNRRTTGGLDVLDELRELELLVSHLSFHEGVLTLEVPKRPELQAKGISIKNG